MGAHVRLARMRFRREPCPLIRGGAWDTIDPLSTTAAVAQPKERLVSSLFRLAQTAPYRGPSAGLRPVLHG